MSPLPAGVPDGGEGVGGGVNGLSKYALRSIQTTGQTREPSPGRSPRRWGGGWGWGERPREICILSRDRVTNYEMERGARNHSFKAVGRARQLRSNMSVGESILWECIRRDKIGFKFRRQVPIGPYIVDFYCPEVSLVVEVDGEQHQNQTVYDSKRDMYLRSKGIHVLRLPSLDLCGGVANQWIDVIQRRCEELRAL